MFACLCLALHLISHIGLLTLCLALANVFVLRIFFTYCCCDRTVIEEFQHTLRASGCKYALSYASCASPEIAVHIVNQKVNSGTITCPHVLLSQENVSQEMFAVCFDTKLSVSVTFTPAHRVHQLTLGAPALASAQAPACWPAHPKPSHCPLPPLLLGARESRCRSPG